MKIGQSQFRFKKNLVERANFESTTNCLRAANRPSVFSSQHRVSFCLFQKAQYTRDVFVIPPHPFLNLILNRFLISHHFHRDLKKVNY